MHITLKNGQRQVFDLDCKKVKITFTSFRKSKKRTSRLRIKAKGKHPKTN